MGWIKADAKEPCWGEEGKKSKESVPDLSEGRGESPTPDSTTWTNYRIIWERDQRRILESKIAEGSNKLGHF